MNNGRAHSSQHNVRTMAGRQLNFSNFSLQRLVTWDQIGAGRAKHSAEAPFFGAPIPATAQTQTLVVMRGH